MWGYLPSLSLSLSQSANNIRPFHGWVQCGNINMKQRDSEREINRKNVCKVMWFMSSGMLPMLVFLLEVISVPGHSVFISHWIFYFRSFLG